MDLAACATGETIRVSAFILPRISVYGGRVGSTATAWPYVRDLVLADPDFRATDSVEILLGADVYAKIVEDGLRKGKTGTPVAQRTSLGWILSGLMCGAEPRGPALSHQCSVAEDLSALVRSFWEQEEPPQPVASLTDEDRRCEKHFSRTHYRLACGRYMVRLPTIPILPSLEDLRRAAVRTLTSMKRKFASNTDFHTLYSDFMQEYETLRHMSLASPPEQARCARICYLPHHGVTKKTEDVAKIRVVFNSSARLASGDALNKALLTGPNLLPVLADVLSRWRLHRFAMATDIEKMYRQVLVHEDDRDLQRVLWRANPAEPIREYRLNTVTYGLTCAPYLAIRTLRQLADDEESRFPEAATVLRRDVYVDDVLTGTNTVAEARQLRDDLLQLCMAGGFPLRKWAANDEELLREIPVNYRQKGGLLEWESDISHSTLGLQWHSRQDAFAYRIRPCEQTTVTKRVVLSETARLYDPPGWLAPLVVRAKITMQSLWLQGIDWDQSVPAEEDRAWRRFRQELPLIEQVRVPRWLHTGGNSDKMELHGFADASERAYAAVLYLRVETDGGEIQVSLLQAKTRVAPLRQVSLPRLELCAASLLARVAERAASLYGVPLERVHLWSDSTVALAWIRGHSSRWTTYVANRVADVQRALPGARWHHVPGEENPADCASRGLSPSDLVHHSLWWRGPAWLGARRWINESPPPEPDEESPEQRVRVHVAAAQDDPELLHRFPGLQRLLRVTAWCRRWLRAGRANGGGGSVAGTLSPRET
ncbi:PREDICTED: uncharacterized protein LOC105448687 [Wasmannia auropunctata]|uniref:uncharacterized protein LOC105448687 n=1 Tax=Wasmannia auropunctata TaxID=64793 RepID=UPI0005EFC76C|nr:PREDICTED: uncharacterized protein LOC105448687 [Wasmannia auropunctata]